MRGVATQFVDRPASPLGDGDCATVAETLSSPTGTSRNASGRPKDRYPSAAAIKRAVKAARSAGLSVSSIEIAADGRILVSEAPRQLITGTTEFEKWESRL